MFIRMRNLLSGLIIGIALASCGGGGGQLAEGGIGGTGISTGSITGFGSVYVNGVKYETSNSTFVMEDRDNSGLLDQDDLEEGMVVTILGEIHTNGTTGTANTVIYTQSVEGPIDGTPVGNSFVVLGRTVIVEDATVIEGTQSYPANFADTDIVEVSGYVDSNGILRARYLENTGDSDFSIHGVVTNASYGVNQFELNGSLIVNWAGSTTVSDNDFVEVKGNVYTPGSPGQLTATSVDIETLGFGIDERDDAELEGISLDDCNNPLPCEISVNGQRVQINNATQFDTGSHLDVLTGSLLEVEGILTGGVLIADEVEFKDEAEVEAQVETIGPDVAGNRIITLTDTGALSGFEIVINETDTTYEGGTDYNDLTLGGTEMHLKFQGKMNSSGQLVAAKVEVGSAPEIELEAMVDGFNALIPGSETVTIMGVDIPTAGLTFILDDGSDLGRAISSSEFYDYLANNEANIEVKGTLSVGTIVWTEIELDL